MRPAWLPQPRWVVAGLVGLLLVVAVLGNKGLLHLLRVQGEVETLQRDIQTLETENARLSRAIAELRDNPSVIERIAREELGLVRPGERVLRFPKTSRPRAPGALSPAPRAP
jgi:cell division protein FtsB